jgi:hypothetical protein
MLAPTADVFFSVSLGDHTMSQALAGIRVIDMTRSFDIRVSV